MKPVDKPTATALASMWSFISVVEAITALFDLVIVKDDVGYGLCAACCVFAFWRASVWKIRAQ